MTDSDIIAAINSVCAHLESQLLATNQSIQEFMALVDNRFAALQATRSSPPAPPGFPSSGHIPPRPPPSDPPQSYTDYEARLDEVKSKFRSGFRWAANATPLNSVPPSQPTQTTSPSPLRLQAPLSVLPSAPMLPSPQIPIKRVSPSEIKEKWDRGLCYTCEKKWSPNHRRRSRFQVLLGTDEDEEAEPPDRSPPPESSTIGTILGNISSLNTFSGLGRPRTLCHTGRLRDQYLRMLVDSGSMHNFIQLSLVKTLQLEAKSVPPFRVYVGDGDNLTCSHLCPKVVIHIQGHKFVVDLHVLAIEGPSVVMGIKWLRTSGPVTHDYAYQWMEFGDANTRIQLFGDASVDNHQISFSQLQALLHSDSVGEIFEVNLWPTCDAGEPTSLLQLEPTTFTPPNLETQVVSPFRDYTGMGNYLTCPLSKGDKKLRSQGNAAVALLRWEDVFH